MNHTIYLLIALNFGLMHAINQTEQPYITIATITPDSQDSDSCESSDSSESDEGRFEISRAAAMQSITIANLMQVGDGSRADEVIPLLITSDDWKIVAPLLQAAANLPDTQKIDSLAQMLPAHSPKQLIQIANTCDYLNFQAGLTAAIQVILDNEIQQNNRDPLKIIRAFCSPDQPYEELYQPLMYHLLNLFFEKMYSELYKLHATLGESEGAHTNWVNALAISPDGTKLFSSAGYITSTGDNTIKVWNITQNLPQLIASLDESNGGHTGGVNALAISPDGTKLFSASDDKTIKVWDIRQDIPRLITTLGLFQSNGRREAVCSLAVSPDGKKLFSGSLNSINVWDITSEVPRLVTTFDPHNVFGNWIKALAVSHDSKKLFTGASIDKNIKVWDITQDVPRLISTLDEATDGNRDGIFALAISHDDKKLFSGSSDGVIKVWNITKETPQLIATLDQSEGGHAIWVLALALSPDRTKLFSGSFDNTIKVWDITQDLPLLIATLNNESHGGHTYAVKALAISSDGKKLFSGSADKTIKVWNLPPNLKDLQNLSCEQTELVVRLSQVNRGQLELSEQDQAVFTSLQPSIQRYFSDNVLATRCAGEIK